MTDFRDTSDTQLPSVDRRGFLTAAAATAATVATAKALGRDYY